MLRGVAWWLHAADRDRSAGDRVFARSVATTILRGGAQSSAVSFGSARRLPVCNAGNT
jgi:hypothetical protein